jgi:hypothetical protein
LGAGTCGGGARFDSALVSHGFIRSKGGSIY